jgi:MoxR-like ATPase
MASSSDLKKGIDIIVNAGPYKGMTGTVIDPKAVPDGQPNQRRVLVSIDGEDTYLLPRLLDLGTTLAPAPAAAALTMADITEASVPGTLATAEPITDPMDPALDRLRPNANIVKEYVSRVLPGGMSDVDYFLSQRDERDSNGYSPNIAMVGDTQSGKTMLVQVLAVLAAERDGHPKPYPVFTVQGSIGVSNMDLYGMTTAVVIDGRETLVWMEGMVPLALRCGGILYLDELNAIPPAQGMAFHPILDDRRSFVNTQKAVPDGHGGFAPEVVKASTALWTIATINPGYKGVGGLGEALNARFRWAPCDYDEAVERKLIKSATVRTMGNLLRSARSRNAISTPVGTSALQRFNLDVAKYGSEMAIWSFLAMFPLRERPSVETIIEDGGIKGMLDAEYPVPTSDLVRKEEIPTPEAAPAVEAF